MQCHKILNIYDWPSKCTVKTEERKNHLLFFIWHHLRRQINKHLPANIGFMCMHIAHISYNKQMFDVRSNNVRFMSTSTLRFLCFIHCSQKLIRIYFNVPTDLCRVLNLSTRLINVSYCQWQPCSAHCRVDWLAGWLAGFVLLLGILQCCISQAYYTQCVTMVMRWTSFMGAS